MANAPLLERPVSVELQTSPADESHAAMEMFERLARDPNASVDKIERLMGMWERVEAKRAESLFNAAMTAAQAEMEAVVPDAYNPQTRSKYASYEALDRELRPIYTRHGFALSFNTGDAPQPDYVRVLCKVTHLAGHAEPYKADMPADGKGAKGGDVMTKTHATGSAYSYGQRYLLKMIFNVAVGEGDDDGNAASGKPSSQEPDGYQPWLESMEDVAAEGLVRLQATWKDSKIQFKNYITNRAPQKWQAIKNKADAADKARKAAR